MYHQPPRTLGLLVGAVLTLWAAAVAVLLANFALGSTFGLASIAAWTSATAAAGLALLFAYWTYALATLSYALDRNGLVITWGATRQVIPLQAIERLVPGTSVGVPSVRGVTWLGYHVGRARIERIGDVIFYSTHQAPEQVLYVMTTERNYAISVPDPAHFAQEIQLRQDLGPTAEITHHVERSATFAQALWQDRTALALVALALLSGAVSWVALALRWPDLPATLQIAFPPAAADGSGEIVLRDAVLALPRMATTVLVVNVVLGVVLHAWERVAGYVLFLAAAGVQVAAVAALQIALSGA